jgi:hypothetical protein
MYMARSNATALNRLNYNEKISDPEDERLLEMLVEKIRPVLNERAEAIRDAYGLDRDLAAIWLASRFAGIAKANIQYAAAQARLSGQSMADIGRATGKLATNIPRDFKDLKAVSAALQRAIDTGEPQKVTIKKWVFNIAPPELTDPNRSA